MPWLLAMVATSTPAPLSARNAVGEARKVKSLLCGVPRVAIAVSRFTIARSARRSTAATGPKAVAGSRACRSAAGARPGTVRRLAVGRPGRADGRTDDVVGHPGGGGQRGAHHPAPEAAAPQAPAAAGPQAACPDRLARGPIALGLPVQPLDPLLRHLERQVVEAHGPLLLPGGAPLDTSYKFMLVLRTLQPLNWERRLGQHGGARIDHHRGRTVQRRGGDKDMTTQEQQEEVVPAELQPVRDLVNTIDFEDGVEELESPAALRDWLVERGLLDPGTAVTAADLTATIELPEALRRPQCPCRAARRRRRGQGAGHVGPAQGVLGG